MPRKKSERGFIITLRMIVFAILLLIVLNVVIRLLGGSIPNESLVWRSDFQEGCPKSPKTANGRDECKNIYQLHDSEGKLIALTQYSDHDNLYAISKDAGELLWDNSSSPGVYGDFNLIEFNGKIYLFGKERCKVDDECFDSPLSKITVLDSSSGENIDEATLPFEPASNPVLVRQKILLVDKGGTLYEIDTQTLNSISKNKLQFWSNDHKPMMKADGDNIYWLGKRFVAYDYTSNNILWELKDGSPYNVLVDDKGVYAIFYSKLLAVDKKTGEIKWTTRASDQLKFPNSYKNSIGIVSDNEIIFLQKDTGKKVNSFPFKNKDNKYAYIRDFIISNDIAYYYYDTGTDFTSKNYVVAKDIATGKELEKIKGPSWSGLLADDNLLYAICNKEICAFKKVDSD